MKTSILSLCLLTLLAFTAVACGTSTPAAPAAPANPAPTNPPAAPASTNQTVSMWFHSGTGDEHDAMMASIKAFQDSNPDIKVNLVNLPSGDYNAQVQAAAFSRKLPCLLDFDGPNMYNYAWAGLLVPLDKYVPADMKADLLP